MSQSLLLLLGLALAAYLIASVSPSTWLVRRRAGVDLRAVGSGNPGATNAWRAAGAGTALVVLAWDLSKGALPVLLARSLGLGTTGCAGVAAAAVLGHVFPVWQGGRGGKGVATSAGGVGAVAPRPVLAAVLIFVAMFGLTRIVSAASLVAVVGLPWIWLMGGRLSWWPAPPAGAVAVVALVAGLVLWCHRDNLVRMIRGTEPRWAGRAPKEGG